MVADRLSGHNRTANGLLEGPREGVELEERRRRVPSVVEPHDLPASVEEEDTRFGIPLRIPSSIVPAIMPGTIPGIVGSSNTCTGVLAWSRPRIQRSQSNWAFWT
jgi:hypothetical protein